MSVVQPLLALQEIDEVIRNLEKALRDLPERKNQERSRLKGVSEAYTLTQSDLKIAQLNVNAIEGEVDERKKRVQRLRDQQQSLKNNRDFQAMSREINLANGDLEKQEARLIAALDQINPAQARVDAAKAKLDAEEAEIEAFIAELDRRAAESQAELERPVTLRAAAATAVTSPQALAMYERLKTRRWPVVVPLSENSVCGGCHLNQPPQTAHLIKRNDGNVVACQMCGRILYMAE